MNVIFTRVSTRKFEDRPVEQEKITQLLKSAMQAPSAGNQQPWEFFVVTDKDKIKSLSQSSPYAGCAAHSTMLVIFVALWRIFFRLSFSLCSGFRCSVSEFVERMRLISISLTLLRDALISSSPKL